MAIGDHLVVSYSSYTHHGIDAGDDHVVHLSKAARTVVRVSIGEFADNRDVWIRDYVQCDTADVVLRRSLESVGRPGYHLFRNNCEHFATWCKTGRTESAQVRTVQRRLASAGTRGLVKVASRFLAKKVSRWGVKSLVRSASPWLFVADVAQLGTEVASSQFGVDPDKAEWAGRSMGLLGATGIGVAVGGPVGGLVGAGLWVVGEIVGSFCSG